MVADGGPELVKLSKESFLVDGNNKEKRFGKYRARLLKTEEIPFVQHLTRLTGKVNLVLDYPNIENVEICEPRPDTPVDENGLSQSQFDGSPLKYDFLTLAKLNTASDPALLHGMPLACLKEEVFHANPIPVAEARTVMRPFDESMGQLNSENWPFDDSGIAVWILTDASDPFRTVFMGSAKHKDGRHSLYNANLYDQRISQSVPQIRQSEEKRFAKLQKKSIVCAKYDLISKIESRERDYSERISSSLLLNARWPTTHEDLLQKPPATATVIVELNPGWLDQGAPFFTKAVQLRFLLALANALRTGEMQWPGNGETTEDGMDINAAIKILIKDDRKLREKIDASRVHNLGYDDAAYSDFTQKLFELLKECRDNSHLIECLSTVFTALKSGELQTMVHSDNPSTLARLVRDACGGQLLLPRLEGLTPIQLLLEIGLHSCQRDYVAEFMQHSFLPNVGELKAYFQLSASPEEQSDALRPILASLQVIVMCRQFLCFPQHQLTVTARQVLNAFCKLSMDEYGYKLNLTMVDIAPTLIDSSHPSEWTMETSYWRDSKAGKQSQNPSSSATTATAVSAKSGSGPAYPNARTVIHFTRHSTLGYVNRVAIRTFGKEEISKGPKKPEQFYHCVVITESIFDPPNGL